MLLGAQALRMTLELSPVLSQLARSGHHSNEPQKQLASHRRQLEEKKEKRAILREGFKHVDSFPRFLPGSFEWL